VKAGIRHLAVRRTARIAVLGTAGPGVREAWIACHGYAQLAPRFIRRFEPIATPERLIVAPEGLNRFYLEGASKAAGPDAAVGATWMTSEDRSADIADYTAYLGAVHDQLFAEVDRARARLVVLGFSQGCATVCRWAATTRVAIDRIILWSGPLPPELEPRPDLFRGARLTFVTGLQDAHVTAAAVAAQGRRMAAGGLEYEIVHHAGGHDIDGATLAALAADGVA
jgi:predicted esterase